MTEPPKRHPDFESWPPPQGTTPECWGAADWPVTVWRGMRGICPHCGRGKIFDGYLKVHAVCSVCGAPLGDMPADDAPPYIAMLVVLQIGGLLVAVFYKGIIHPHLLVMSIVLLVMTLICMAALRVAKGAVIAILLKLGFKRGVLNG